MTTNRKWSTRNRMVTRPMTSRDPERSSRDPNTFKAQYLETEMLFSNNCCEAVRSAIIATAWLLVYSNMIHVSYIVICTRSSWDAQCSSLLQVHFCATTILSVLPSVCLSHVCSDLEFVDLFHLQLVDHTVVVTLQRDICDTETAQCSSTTSPADCSFAVLLRWRLSVRVN